MKASRIKPLPSLFIGFLTSIITVSVVYAYEAFADRVPNILVEPERQGQVITMIRHHVEERGFHTVGEGATFVNLEQDDRYPGTRVEVNSYKDGAAIRVVARRYSFAGQNALGNQELTSQKATQFLREIMVQVQNELAAGQTGEPQP